MYYMKVITVTPLFYQMLVQQNDHKKLISKLGLKHHLLPCLFFQSFWLYPLIP